MAVKVFGRKSCQWLLDIAESQHYLCIVENFHFRITGDRNCLYNAVSVAVIRNKSLTKLLRALTSAMLFVNKSYYASHLYFLSFLLKENVEKLLSRIFTVAYTFEASDILGEKENKGYTSCVEKRQ